MAAAADDTHRAPVVPPLAAKLVLSALSASVAEAATYPLDLLKTRLQLQGELQRGSAPLAGLLRTAAQVLRQEGAAGLYAGLPPAVARHLPYTGLRVVAFEQLRGAARRWYCGVPPAGAGTGLQLPLPLHVTLAMGMTAGALGQAAAVPADLIKVRMQADGRRAAAGEPRRYRGVLHAANTILKERGVIGLWTGSAPAVQRAALVNLGELTTYDWESITTAYDFAKRQVVRSGITGGDNPAAHALSSLASGLCASLVSTPADVVKTRLMAQDAAAPLYRGTLDCFLKTLAAEGARGLYKGFWPTWARLAPWQLTFWTTYEQARRLSGLQPF